MPKFATYVAFIGAMLAYQLSGVGPDMMLVIGRGVGDGRRAALAAAVGCVAAGIIQIPLLALGLASAVMSSPALYQGIQLAGAAYLIFIGVKLLVRSRNARATPAPGVSSSTASAFRQGMVCNLTNPSTIVFMLAVLPQFVEASSTSPALQFLLLGATMKASGLVILGAVALTSGAAGGWLARNGAFLAWQQRFAGAVMIAIGLRMALAVAAPSFRR